MNVVDPHAALSRWAMPVRTCIVAAERENVVYRVEDNDATAYALRFHRRGYRSVNEIESELRWMAELDAHAVLVPKPILSKAGTFIETVNGQFVSVLTWIPGQPLGKASQPLMIDDRLGTFFRFGETLAKVHAVSDRWQRPKNFDRPAWDIDGLTGPEPYWGKFWENPALSAKEAQLIMLARDKARNALLAQSDTLDFGLVHADLVRENVLVEGAQIKFIDFDDCGTGFRLFDIATALLKNQKEPDYAELEASFLQGYRSVRPIDTTLLRVFFLLRAFTYLGWIIPRMTESGAQLRNERNIKASLELATEFVDLH